MGNCNLAEYCTIHVIEPRTYIDIASKSIMMPFMFFSADADKRSFGAMNCFQF